MSEKQLKSFPWKRLMQISIVAFVVASLLVVVPKIDFAALKLSLLTIDLFHLTLSLLGVAGLWLCRCLLLGRLMNLRTPFPFSRALSIGLMGGFMDQIIPARGGMVFRWALIHKVTKASKSFVFSALMAAFVFEGIGLLVLFLGVLAFDAKASEFSSPPLTVLFIVGISGLILLVPFSKWILKKIAGTWLQKLRPFVALLEMAAMARDPLILSEWLLIVVIMWISNIFVAHQLGLAFHLELPLSQLIIMLFVINVAILVPAVPGNLGTMQLAISWILGRFSVGQSVAVAYSLVFHAVHVIPIVILGALVLIRHSAKGGALGAAHRNES